MKKHQFITTTALMIGYMIGAGVLALPVNLGLTGAVPSVFLIIVYGIVMKYTSDVLADEICAEKAETVDYPTLYGKYMGKAGTAIAVIANLTVLYGLLIAYISGATNIIQTFFDCDEMSLYIMLGISAVLICLTVADIEAVNKYNTVFVALIFMTFITMIILSFDKIDVAALKETNLKYGGVSIPVVIAAFIFQNLIPVLCKKTEWNASATKRVMSCGMVLVIIVYAAWTVCSIGCLPRYGENGIINTYINNFPATIPMEKIIGSPLFKILATAFSLLAIVTSFIANGLALNGFLNDLVHNSFKMKLSQTVIKIIAFLPPVVIVLLWPQVFLKALEIVGGVGGITLFGLFPCAIVFVKKNNSLKRKGKAAICGILCVAALIMIIASITGIEAICPNPLNELN